MASKESYRLLIFGESSFKEERVVMTFQKMKSDHYLPRLFHPGDSWIGQTHDNGKEGVDITKPLTTAWEGGRHHLGIVQTLRHSLASYFDEFLQQENPLIYIWLCTHCCHHPKPHLMSYMSHD